MRCRKRTLGALILLLAAPLPMAAQKGSTTGPRRVGPLRLGPELRAEAPPRAIACRSLSLAGRTRAGDIFLGYFSQDYVPLMEGFFAFRSCEVDASAKPPRPKSLGAWVIVDPARRNVDYPRFYLFEGGRSTPAWRRNLVAYWGVFKGSGPAGGGAGVLQAVVVDWQNKVIVAREPTQIASPPEGEPLPAPRWVRQGSAANQEPAEAQFAFAGKTVHLEISPRFLR